MSAKNGSPDHLCQDKSNKPNQLQIKFTPKLKKSQRRNPNMQNGNLKMKKNTDLNPKRKRSNIFTTSQTSSEKPRPLSTPSKKVTSKSYRD